MPRPKSGKPPLTAIAVKVPPDLLAEVQRYTDLHRLSISALVREGLTLRMQHQGPVPDAPSMPAYAYNGYTATEDPTQPGVAAALAAIRETLRTHGETLAALLDAHTHTESTGIPESITVIPAEASAQPQATPGVAPVSGYGAGIAAVRAAALEQQVFSCAELAAALGRPGKAVHQDLHKLVKAGMLIQEGAQRQARYRVVG